MIQDRDHELVVRERVRAEWVIRREQRDPHEHVGDIASALRIGFHGGERLADMTGEDTVVNKCFFSEMR